MPVRLAEKTATALITPRGMLVKTEQCQKPQRFDHNEPASGATIYQMPMVETLVFRVARSKTKSGCSNGDVGHHSTTQREPICMTKIPFSGVSCKEGLGAIRCSNSNNPGPGPVFFAVQLRSDIDPHGQPVPGLPSRDTPSLDQYLAALGNSNVTYFTLSFEDLDSLLPPTTPEGWDKLRDRVPPRQGFIMAYRWHPDEVLAKENLQKAIMVETRSFSVDDGPCSHCREIEHEYGAFFPFPECTRGPYGWGCSNCFAHECDCVWSGHHSVELIHACGGPEAEFSHPLGYDKMGLPLTQASISHALINQDRLYHDMHTIEFEPLLPNNAYLTSPLLEYRQRPRARPSVRVAEECNWTRQGCHMKPKLRSALTMTGSTETPNSNICRRCNEETYQHGKFPFLDCIRESPGGPCGNCIYAKLEDQCGDSHYEA
ncbi:hypothetical protein PG997_013687 [Apiospora hydei]|uniref:Uncharacterized protein n=1 Tax=Apiospora hydei TaxID=1337664 RepID=A0ABR1V6W7_9PEZI